MPDKTKVFVCLVCKREYKFDDQHRCLDNGFEKLEYRRQSPDYAHKREYMREYMKRKRKMGRRDSDGSTLSQSGPIAPPEEE